MSNKYVLGGWSMSLGSRPINEFDVIIYGMITSLDSLSSGTWSPESSNKPNNNPSFRGKTLWVYGGAGCGPSGRPSNAQGVTRIVNATVNRKWDGVDFDDECDMNNANVISAMRQLKSRGKTTSFGFLAGWSYVNNDPLNQKVKALISSGQCDYLVHYCYANAMWSDAEVRLYVNKALKQTLSYGASSKKVILALTTIGLTDWNLNYFLDQVVDLKLGGLFIWRCEQLSASHLAIIKRKLNK